MFILLPIPRYGFERSRSQKALQAQHGDIGKALEYLLSQCFELKLSTKDEDEDTEEGGNDVETHVCWDDINEQRTEEKTALESIYGAQFQEKIPKEVWTMSLELPHLTAFASQAKSKEDGGTLKNVKETWAKPDAEVCRFYLKGFCKFGNRCYNRHELPCRPMENESRSCDDGQQNFYTVEIRFPKGNKYPNEAPFIAFCSTNPLLSSHVCLNITNRLLQEAKEQAQSCLPVVFSLVSVLQSEQELDSILKQPPAQFSLPEPIICRKQAVDVVKTVKESVGVRDQAQSAAENVCGVNKSRDENGVEAMQGTRRTQNLKQRYPRREGGQGIRSVTSVSRESIDMKLKQRYSKSQVKEFPALNGIPLMTKSCVYTFNTVVPVCASEPGFLQVYA